jgi:hypothetical protein
MSIDARSKGTMKLVLSRDILSQLEVNGILITWLEAGTYQVVRFFDEKRVLIDCASGSKRQLTVVPISKGKLVRD